MKYRYLIATALLFSGMFSACKTKNSFDQATSLKSSEAAERPSARLEYPSRWLMKWPDDQAWQQKWAAWSEQKAIPGTKIRFDEIPKDARGAINTEARSIWYNTSQGSGMAPAALFLALETKDKIPFAHAENLSKYGFIYPPADEKGEGAYRSTDFLKSSEYSYLGLPLGMTPDIAKRKGLEGTVSIGPTCAVCHTSELVTDVKGVKTRVVVDGGQPLLDFVGFMTDFTAEMARVNTSSAEKQKFCENVARIERDFVKPAKYFYQQKENKNCEKHLEITLNYFTDRLNRNKEKVAAGVGRLDALGNLINELLVYHIGFGANEAIKPSAPISYPYLWSVPNLECVQTNCLTSDPLTRNLGEVSGTFGLISVGPEADTMIPAVVTDTIDKVKTQLDGQSAVSFPKIRSSSSPLNMFILEDSLKTLPSPKWSELYDIDEELAKEGKRLYESKEFLTKLAGTENAEKRSCESCHVYVDNRNKNSLAEPSLSLDAAKELFLKSPKMLQVDVGTDNAFLAQATTKTVPTAMLPLSVQLSYKLLVAKTVIEKAENRLRKIFDDPLSLFSEQNVVAKANLKERLDNIPALAAFGIVNRFSVDGWARDRGLSESDMGVLHHNHASVRPLDVNVYKARPLNGIVFSAPYLHNGSVPNLAALLEAPENRPDVFMLNSVRYDRESLGYVSQQDAVSDTVKAFTYDTSLDGNRNTGHPWGKDWTPAQKRALLEYLKTL